MREQNWQVAVEGAGVGEVKGVSRRDLIRKATVAGGIVWATPVIQTMTTAASAAGTPEPGCPDCAQTSCLSGCGAYTFDSEGCFCSTGPTGVCEHVFFPTGQACEEYAACGPAPGYTCLSGIPLRDYVLL